MLETGMNTPRLETLEQLAVEASAEHVAVEVRALSERVRSGLFYVVCVGQFKRGKSTLLNALIGEPLLPMGVVPVTAVVTVVRHGVERRARVRFGDRAWRDVDPEVLVEYVSEKENPENKKGVAAVEVFAPSPLLASGMCLVDTPGIGSVFLGSSEATRAFLPHVDAALVVLGADPPISADELALIGEIAGKCPDILFVMNKVDKLTQAERQEVAAFTREVLYLSLGQTGVPFYEVSATERLAGTGHPLGWRELTEALSQLAHGSGSALIQAAKERGFAFLADKLRRYLDEERGALLRPIEESEQRIEELHTCLAEAEQSLNDLGHLLTSEQERLERIFAEQKEAFLNRSTPQARREFAEALNLIQIRRGPELRRKAIDLAHDISKRQLDFWLAEIQPAAETLYVEAARRFVQLANGFLEKLATAGDAAHSALPRSVAPESGFRVRSGLYYTFLMSLTSQTPAGWFLDVLRPRTRQLTVLEHEVGDYMEHLIFTNANRIQNDFNDLVMESRRQLQFEIRAALTECATSAERALARAKHHHARGHQAVRTDIERIDALSARLEALGSTIDNKESVQ